MYNTASKLPIGPIIGDLASLVKRVFKIFEKFNFAFEVRA